MVVLIVLVALALSRSSDAFRTSPLLDSASYLANASSLRGNTYKLSGEVSDMLAWSPTGGRLIAVATEAGNRILPVQVTDKFNSVNIQKGQRIDFLVEVDEKGILKTKGLKVQ